MVIALQEPFVVRTRSNDRNALDSGSEWQHPVVAQQDGRLCHSLTSQSALLRRLEGHIGGCRVNVGMLEESELKFEAQHALNGCVNDLQWHPSSLDFSFQWLAIAVNLRQLHIEPSQQGEPSGLPSMCRDMMMVHEHQDGGVVSDDNASEAEFVAQQLGQDGGAACTG